MSYVIDICLICLKHSSNLELIKDGDVIGNKLKYFVPEIELNLNIPEYICAKCVNKLNTSYEFKQKCLQNITTYKKYAQQITTEGCFKSVSVVIRPDFIYDDYVTNEALIINEQTKELPDIEKIYVKSEENEDTFNKNQKMDEVLVSKNKIESLLLVIEQEISKSDQIEEENEISQIKFHFMEPKNVGINKEKYKCKICDKSFNFPQSLANHQLTHSETKAHTCEVCNKSYKHAQGLKRHQLVHTNEKPFSCEVCNKSFALAGVLKEHKLVHTDEKLFTCEVCNKSFRQPKSLRQHRMIHTGEKPFACEVCSRVFNDLRSLKRHRATHSTKRPFSCDVCNASFKLLQTLNKHKLLHTDGKAFICEVCNKSFRHSSNLKEHKTVHTGDRPFSCDICNKSYRLLQSLKEHKIIHSNKRLFACEKPTEGVILKYKTQFS